MPLSTALWGRSFLTIHAGQAQASLQFTRIYPDDPKPTPKDRHGSLADDTRDERILWLRQRPDRVQAHSRECGVSSELALLAAIAACSLESLCAQDLAPRAYVISPLHYNAAIVSYSFFDGSILLTGTPITGATGTYQVPIFSLFHSFGVLGRSASIHPPRCPLRSGEFPGNRAGRGGTALPVPDFWIQPFGSP